MSIPTYPVWDFRIRYHFKKNPDTKASRKVLRVKFGAEYGPFMDKLLAAYDAEREYKDAMRIRDQDLSLGDLYLFLEQASECMVGFSERVVPKLPPSLKQAAQTMLAEWSRSTVKLERATKPVQKRLSVMQRNTTKAHTKWIRSIEAAKRVFAALGGEV